MLHQHTTDVRASQLLTQQSVQSLQATIATTLTDQASELRHLRAPDAFSFAGTTTIDDTLHDALDGAPNSDGLDTTAFQSFADTVPFADTEPTDPDPQMYRFDLNSTAKKLYRQPTSSTPTSSRLRRSTTPETLTDAEFSTLQARAYLNQVNPDPAYLAAKMQAELQARLAHEASNRTAPYLEYHDAHRLEYLLGFVSAHRTYTERCTVQNTLPKAIQLCAAKRIYDAFYNDHIEQQTSSFLVPQNGTLIESHLTSTGTFTPPRPKHPEITDTDFVRFLYKRYIPRDQLVFVKHVILLGQMGRKDLRDMRDADQYMSSVTTYLKRYEAKLLHVLSIEPLLPQSYPTPLNTPVDTATQLNLTAIELLDSCLCGLQPGGLIFQILCEPSIVSVYRDNKTASASIPLFIRLASAILQAAHNF
jgi:hypothetical protein